MRARNIKPSFFTNEALGVLDPIIQLTFAGLWCLADRDGILEDRPLRIKAELFPYRDNLDVNGYLTVLERTGFIQRYEVSGVRYIEVLAFAKHQSPHNTEKAKGYPANPLKLKGNADLPLDNGEITVTKRPDSLIPDSLIPDSNTVSPDGDASKKPAKKPSSKKTPIPADFTISDSVRKWAAEKGHTRLDEHFERFVGSCQAKGYLYADWDAALRNAITADWAKLATAQAKTADSWAGRDF